MKRRILSIFCVLALCLGLLPATALAVDDWTYYPDGNDSTISAGETTLKVSRSGQDLTITGVSVLASSGELVLPTAATSRDGLKTYTVTGIGAGAFKDCSSLTSITVPDGFTIGKAAFADCTNLKSVTLPSDLTAIPSSLFDGCTSLTDIEWPENITSIGNYAFRNCSSLTSITVPSGVTGIGNDAFYGCSKLKRIELPESITSIGAYAFQNCTSLTDITLPEKISEIDSATFRDCTSLTSITVPGAVTEIGYYAFYGCTNLKEVTVLATTPPTLDSAAFNGGTSNSLTAIYVPAESVEAYKGATNWSSFASKIQAIVEESMTLTPDSESWEGAYGTDFESKTFTIANVGDDALTISSVELSGTNADDFTLNAENVGTALNGNGTATFTVTPKADLGVGTYNATVTVTATVNGETETKEATLTCTVNAKSLTGAAVSVSGEYTYDGSEIVPGSENVTVTLDGETLTENTDYTLSYENNTNAGEATVKATGKGNYSGTVTGTFQIAKATPDYTVPTGLTATYGDTLADVALPDDWAWDDAVTTSVGNVGDNTFAATFTPSDTANYNTVTENLTVAVSAKDITNAVITLGDALTYTGQQQTQQIASVTVDDLTVTTYEIFGNTGTDADTYTLTISGTGNFTGTATKEWSIAKANYTGTTGVSGTVLANWSDKVTLPAIPAGASYGTPSTTDDLTGLSIEGSVLSYTGGSDITEGREYKITVPVNGGKNYNDYEITVTLTGKDKQELDITGVTAQGGTYNGQTQAGYTGTPSAQGYTGDFTVTYNTTDGKAPANAGTYTVTFAIPDSIPQYAGSVDLEFTIAQKPLTVSAADVSVYTGSAAPELTLVYDGLVTGERLTPTEAPTFTITKADGTEIALANAVKTAGTYTITWSNAGNTTFPDGANYAIQKKTTGTLTVSNRSSGGTTTYPVQVEENIQNGGVQVSPKNAVPGTLVTVTPQPASGYELATLSVLDQYGNEVDVNPLGNGNYSFKMPRSGVKVEATFYCTGSELCPTHHLADVLVKAWYHDAVDYVVEHGIMTGTSATTFEPNTTLSRAMVAQILYNLEGQPAVEGESTFTDSNTHWAAKAIAWAQKTGVVSGYGNNTFRPNQAVTREELAQMLYNYAEYKQYDLTASGDLIAFPDGNNVQGWAKTAMSWANGNQLINGFEDDTLRPGGDSTRAQAASILMNFDVNLVEE